MRPIQAKNYSQVSINCLPGKAIEDVEKDDKGVYVVSGPRIDRMLGYTNLESEKGFNFFQKFLRQTGILKQLKELGVQEGDTVRVGDYLEFDYYD